jgi:hypothetical protein
VSEGGREGGRERGREGAYQSFRRPREPSRTFGGLEGLRGSSGGLGGLRGLSGAVGSLGSLRGPSTAFQGTRGPSGLSGALGGLRGLSGALGGLGGFRGSRWSSEASGGLQGSGGPSGAFGGPRELSGGSRRPVSAVWGWLVAARWHFARCFADNARTTHGQRTDNATDNAAANTAKTIGKTTKINDLVWQELKAPSYIKENNIIDPAGDFGRFVVIYNGFAHVVRSVVRSVVRALSVRCPCVVRKTPSEMTPGCHKAPRDRRDREEPPGAARSFQDYQREAPEGSRRLPKDA